MTKMISARPGSALRLEVAFCVIPKLVVNCISLLEGMEKSQRIQETDRERERERAKRLKDSVD